MKSILAAAVVGIALVGFSRPVQASAVPASNVQARMLDNDNKKVVNNDKNDKDPKDKDDRSKTKPPHGGHGGDDNGQGNDNHQGDQGGNNNNQGK